MTDQPKSLHIDNYRVSSYHSDCKQQLSIVSLFNFLQESAWHHASKNAFGFDDLLNNGYFWALTRIKVVIDKFPFWGNALHVETWSKEPDALMAYRDFEIFNDSHDCLIKASSAWLIVDIKTRRPQRMSSFKNSFPHLLTRHAIETHPAKLNNLDYTKSINEKIIHEISFSDIDMNGHVNNANYVRWVLDSFPFSFIIKHNIVEIEVNFLRESKAGEHYYVTINDELNGAYLCNVVRAEDQCELARIFVKFDSSAFNV